MRQCILASDSIKSRSSVVVGEDEQQDRPNKFRIYLIRACARAAFCYFIKTSAKDDPVLHLCLLKRASLSCHWNVAEMLKQLFATTRRSAIQIQS